MQPTIHEACRNGKIRHVMKLVAENPSLVDADDEHGWRPIFVAAFYRRKEIVKFLLESGADISARDGRVLHFAAESPLNKDIVAMLLQYGALESHTKPPSEPIRQLLASIYLGDSKRVSALLKSDSSLAQSKDGFQTQPIHHAAICGDLKIVRILVEAGADVNARDGEGRPALTCAGLHGHAKVVEYLLDQGADPAARFGKENETLIDCLDRYSDDERLLNVLAVLSEHAKQDGAT